MRSQGWISKMMKSTIISIYIRGSGKFICMLGETITKSGTATKNQFTNPYKIHPFLFMHNIIFSLINMKEIPDEI